MVVPTQPAAVIVLDRDGTLIEDVPYLRDPDQVRLRPGVGEALQSWRAAGCRLFMYSNQSGIVRGLIRPAELAAVHRRLVELLPVRLDGWCYACGWAGERKPHGTYLHRLRARYAPAPVIMIGDRDDVDGAAARAAGVEYYGTMHISVCLTC